MSTVAVDRWSQILAPKGGGDAVDRWSKILATPDEHPGNMGPFNEEPGHDEPPPDAGSGSPPLPAPALSRPDVLNDPVYKARMRMEDERRRAAESAHQGPMQPPAQEQVWHETPPRSEFAAGFRQSIAGAIPPGLDVPSLQRWKDKQGMEKPAEGAAGVAGEIVGGAAALPAMVVPRNPGDVAALLGAGPIGRAAAPVVERVAAAAGEKVAKIVAHQITLGGVSGGQAALHEAGSIPVDQWAADPMGSAWRVILAGGKGVASGVATGTLTGAAHAALPGKTPSVARTEARSEPQQTAKPDTMPAEAPVSPTTGSPINPVAMAGAQPHAADQLKTGGTDAPRQWYRGQHDKQPKGGDEFYSADESIAGDYAERGSKPTTLQNPPKNPLLANSKEELADLIGYEGDPRAEPFSTPISERFDTLAKQYAQSRGHDAIEYENGSMDAPELHVFGPRAKPSPQPVPEQAATLEAQAQMLADGKRRAILVTPGANAPKVPTGFEKLATSKGTFIFNPEKIDAAEIRTAVKNEVAGKSPAIGDVLDMGISNKPEPGTEVGTMVVRGPEGIEKQAVVTDAANLPSVKAAAEKVAGPGDTVALEHPTKVIEDRLGASAAKEPWEMTREDFGSTEIPELQTLLRKRMTANNGMESSARRGNDLAVETYRDEYKELTRQINEKIASLHGAAVKKAISEGKPVPPEVLADYPDLKPKEPPRAQVEEASQLSQGLQKQPQGHEKALPQEVRAGEAVQQEVRPEPTTSARKVDTAADREAMGLDALDSPTRRGWEEVLTTAKKKGGSADKAMTIVADVTAKPRALSDVETAGLVVHGTSLKNAHAEIMRSIAATDDPAAIAFHNAELNRVEADFDALSQTLRSSGTEKGRALAAQKLTINQGYDLVSNLTRAKAAKGSELTPYERGKIEVLTKQLAESTAKVEQLSKQINDQIADRAIRRHKAQNRGMKPEAHKATFETLLADALRLVKAGCR